MLLLIVIALLVVALLIGLWIRNVYITGVRRLIYIYINNYEDVREILSQNLEIDEITQYLLGNDVENGENNWKDIEIKAVYFGINSIEFKNTKELRQCFLLAGQYILECEETAADFCSYQFEGTEEHQVFMEALRNVRQMCLANGESTIL